MKIVADSSPWAAVKNGLHPIGTIGVLLQAKRLGHIEAMKPCLDELISEKIRIGNKLYLQALELANE